MTNFQKEHDLWRLVEQSLPLLPEAQRAQSASEIAQFRASLARREAAAMAAPIGSAASGLKAGAAALETGGKSLSGHLVTAGKVTAGIVATAVLLDAWGNHRAAKREQSWAQRIDAERERPTPATQAR